MNSVTLEVLILKSLSRLLNFLRKFLAGKKKKKKKEFVTHVISLLNVNFE